MTVELGLETFFDCPPTRFQTGLENSSNPSAICATSWIWFPALGYQDSNLD